MPAPRECEWLPRRQAPLLASMQSVHPGYRLGPDPCQSTVPHLIEPRSYCSRSLLCWHAKSTHLALLVCSSWSHLFSDMLRSII